MAITKLQMLKLVPGREFLSKANYWSFFFFFKIFLDQQNMMAAKTMCMSSCGKNFGSTFWE